MQKLNLWKGFLSLPEGSKGPACPTSLKWSFVSDRQDGETFTHFSIKPSQILLHPFSSPAVIDWLIDYFSDCLCSIFLILVSIDPWTKATGLLSLLLLLGVLCWATGLLQWGSGLYLKKKKRISDFSSFKYIFPVLECVLRLVLLGVWVWVYYNSWRWSSSSLLQILHQQKPVIKPLVSLMSLIFTWGLTSDAGVLPKPALCWVMQEQRCCSHRKNREAMM